MIHQRRSYSNANRFLWSSRCLPFSRGATCTLSLQAQIARKHGCLRLLLQASANALMLPKLQESSGEKQVVIQLYTLLHSYHAHSQSCSFSPIQKSKGPKWWFQGLEESLHGSPQLISQGGLQERMTFDFHSPCSLGFECMFYLGQCM